MAARRAAGAVPLLTLFRRVRRRDSVRKSFTRKEQPRAWKRDHGHCGYCRKHIFFAPSLRLLNHLNVGHGYYRPNGKNAAMLRLFAGDWPSVDHIHSVGLGGTNDSDNLNNCGRQSRPGFWSVVQRWIVIDKALIAR